MASTEWSVEEITSLRRGLREVLSTEVEFEAFCIDCFRSIHALYFSSGMDRLHKENLLLQHTSLPEIRESLEQWRIHLQSDAELHPGALRSSYQKKLSRQLQDLYDRKEQSLLSGQEVRELDAQILSVRREQRHGPSLHHGEVLGDRFVLDRIIGNGGFACVWRAYDRQNRNMVAVKVLHGQWSADASRIERFFRGAKRMAELHQPAVVRVIVPAQQDSGFYFFATEYLSGGDLRRALLSRQITDKQAMAALLQIGEAMQYAHERKFIHRDIKPSNILLDEHCNAKIGDFDLVHVPDSSGGTRTTAIGSVFYAAPEAMENAKLVDSPTSDIYSLGMTLAFIVYGRDLPQQAWTNRDGFWQELRCSTRIRSVIERATSILPQDRHPSAEVFCQALRTALDEDESGVLLPTSLQRGSTWLARRSFVGRRAAAIAVAIAAVGGLLFFVWSGSRREPPSAVKIAAPSHGTKVDTSLPALPSDSPADESRAVPASLDAPPPPDAPSKTRNDTRAVKAHSRKDEEDDYPPMELHPPQERH